MTAVTNGSVAQTSANTDDSSAGQCVVSSSGEVTMEGGNENDDTEQFDQSSLLKLSTDDTQSLCNSFTSLVNSLVGLVKKFLAAGNDYKFDESFFGFVIRNLPLNSLPGQQLATSLANVTFPTVADANSLVSSSSAALTSTTTVSAVVSSQSFFQ